jgi:chromosome segregation ATPase
VLLYTRRRVEEIVRQYEERLRALQEELERLRAEAEFWRRRAEFLERSYREEVELLRAHARQLERQLEEGLAGCRRLPPLADEERLAMAMEIDHLRRTVSGLQRKLAECERRAERWLDSWHELFLRYTPLERERVQWAAAHAGHVVIRVEPFEELRAVLNARGQRLELLRRRDGRYAVYYLPLAVGPLAAVPELGIAAWRPARPDAIRQLAEDLARRMASL